MVKIQDSTGIAWEKSPAELIHSLIKSIPPELVPKCHYMTRILHPDSSGPNFPEFQLVVHPPSYQTVTAMGKFATCSVHLAISREGYRKVPIEYRIFYYIGIEWLGSYEKYDENNEDETEHRTNEYATVCFANYVQSQNITSGFHGDFPPGFVQRKIEEARKIVSARSYFPWPDTLVADNSTGMLSEVNWPREGMLKYKGYSVGSFSNITSWERQVILREVYEEQLPNLVDSGYMAQWGSPQSAQRLKKMAESIASFTRSAKRKRSQGNFDVAIADWEEDLAWLKKEFYDGVYDRIFLWPNLKI